MTGRSRRNRGWILLALLMMGQSLPGRDSPIVGSFGFDMSGMDRMVRPGSDFYRFANGAWDQRTAIPADRSNTGVIERLEDLSRERIKAILEEAARDRTSRSGRAFSAFLDEGRIEALGLSPVAPWLDRLKALRTSADYLAAAADAGKRGVTLPIAFDVEPDDGQSDRYALIIGQGGLGLPDRDYYLSDTAAMLQVRSAYQAYLTDMLRIAGVDDAAVQAAGILALETKIAAANWTAAASRDATRTYNPVATGALDTGIATLVRDLGYRTARAVVRQPDAVAAIGRLIATAPVPVVRNMLIVRTLHRYAEVLPHRVRDVDFALYGRVVDGVDKPEPRWRRGVAFVLEAMPDEVSRAYVARFFSPATHDAAVAMVRGLVAAFDRRIDGLDWMTPETRVRAHRKLAAFRPQIGYPERWHDYAGLVVREGDAFGNMMRARLFRHDWDARKIGRPIYRWEWSATPMTVDAFANYPKVEIVFPAAILQPPFFDPLADPAINYGGIGASIAHEMTHHFDDQGSKYDEAGRLTSWWSAADRAAFEARTAVLARQFDLYEPLPGQHVNGTLTLGENIADLGGLTIAYDAYHASLQGRGTPVLEGLSGDQRFFLGWAQIWRLKYRDADLGRRLLTNPHAPAAQRVWTVRNVDGWASAYGVTPGDALYLAPERRARIW
jgi:putative endopeptidase